MKTARSRKGATIHQRVAGGEWRLRVERAGVQHYFPLSRDREEALAKADEIRAYLVVHSVDETKAHFLAKAEPAPESKQKPLLVRDILDAYDKVRPALDIRDNTFREYKGGIRRLVAPLFAGKDPDDAPLALVCPEAAAKARLRLLDGETDGSRIMSRKRSFNALLRAVKSLFTEEARKFYPPLPPEVDAFLKEKPFRKVPVLYVIPPSPLIEKTVAALPGLKASDPEAWFLIYVALHAGMRREEIAMMSRSWVRPDYETPRIYIQPEGDFTPKGRLGYTEIAKPFLDEVNAQFPGTAGSFMPGTYTDRYHLAGNRANVWLRELGWDQKKPLHELRKLYGSCVATTKGLFVAQRLLRHSDPNMTNRYYADVVASRDVIRLVLGNAEVAEFEKAAA